MIEKFSHQILRKIVSDIQQNEFYAVTADGIQDISGQSKGPFVGGTLTQIYMYTKILSVCMKFPVLPVTFLLIRSLMS
jgi:hypothetical protein